VFASNGNQTPRFLALSWWYRHYANEQSPADRLLYEDAENKAKAEGLGLWQDPDPMPPWEWRHRR